MNRVFPVTSIVNCKNLISGLPIRLLVSPTININYNIYYNAKVYRYKKKLISVFSQFCHNYKIKTDLSINLNQITKMILKIETSRLCDRWCLRKWYYLSQDRELTGPTTVGFWRFNLKWYLTMWFGVYLGQSHYF